MAALATFSCAWPISPVRRRRDAGAVTVGINPLHMLFPHERERASPYHPSDRRFLDPIYLDLDALRELPGFTQISPRRNRM